MSWIDRINNIQLKVTTGEGSEFTPIYKGATRNRNMNASVFNFNNIEGSLVKRGYAESMKYPFEFHFQGEDNIDEAERFNKASLDKRPWTLTHPIYGDLLVQPINLSFSNSYQNDTVVSGELYETITDTYPDSSIGVQEQVLETIENIQALASDNFNIDDIYASLTSSISESMNDISESYQSYSVSDLDLQNVINAFNDAKVAFNNYTQDPVTFMNQLSTLLITPAKFYSSIEDRINVMKESYENLKEIITIDSSKNEKTYFELASCIIISGIAEASVIDTDEIADDQQIDDNDIEDYETRSDVLNIIQLILDIYDDFIETLGNMQSDIDADIDSYTPKQDSLNSLKEAINQVCGQLINLATDAKQERKYILPDDINLVMLVHRLLGTTDEDEIVKFANNNEILLEEWLQIKKGREIVYYL